MRQGEAIIDASQIGAMRKIGCESSMLISNEVVAEKAGVYLGKVVCKVSCDHCGIDRTIGPLTVTESPMGPDNAFNEVGNGIEYIVLSECKKKQA